MSVAAVDALPPVSPVAGQILEAIEHHSLSIDQLEALLAKEPALAAATLHVVNHAGIGLEAPVASVGAAIEMIGLLRLRSLAVAHAVASLRSQVPAPARSCAERVWQHALQTGRLARLLAERTGCPWVEEAFVAGVLHDCGRLVLLANLSERYLELSAEQLPDLRVERERFGTDHCELGAQLAQHWRLPEQLVATCRDHHLAVADDHPHAELLRLVLTADQAMTQLSAESARDLLCSIGLRVHDPLCLMHDLQREAVAQIDGLSGF